MDALPVVMIQDPCLARAFVQRQAYSGRWSPREGLERGTIFPELYSPYIPSEYVVKGGRCRVS
ncbi:MAG: spore coat associated protein CotJA [Patescibacteria group bacterium]